MNAKFFLDLITKFSPFIGEMVGRFFQGKPKFFQVVQNISLAVGAVSGVLLYLNQNGVQLPSEIAWLGDWVAVVGAITAVIIAQLPVPNPEPAKDAEPKPAE